MKQALMITLVTLSMVALPALSIAGNDSGFLQHRSGTVFERGDGTDRHDERQHYVKARHKEEKRFWKEERRRARYDRYEKVKRHRHNQRHWRQNRYYEEPRVVYRYAPPRRIIVRERVVVSPIVPVPVPPSLVFHFSW